jgi:hypothetical protein
VAEQIERFRGEATMTTAIAPTLRPLGYPWCNKCDKPVESVEWKNNIQPVESWTGLVEWQDDGIRTIIVHCHGEKWTCQWRSGVSFNDDN